MLQYAMQQLQTAQTEIANRRATLDQWAMNNATTIQGLKSNLQQIQPLTNTNLSYNTIPTIGTKIDGKKAAAIDYVKF